MLSCLEIWVGNEYLTAELWQGAIFPTIQNFLEVSLISVETSLGALSPSYTTIHTHHPSSTYQHTSHRLTYSTAIYSLLTSIPLSSSFILQPCTFYSPAYLSHRHLFYSHVHSTQQHNSHPITYSTAMYILLTSIPLTSSFILQPYTFYSPAYLSHNHLFYSDIHSTHQHTSHIIIYSTAIYILLTSIPLT